jgi:lipoic acid synthetase
MIHQVHENVSQVPAKFGLVLGLGETANIILTVLKKLRSAHCHMVSIGQYLQPVYAHFPAHQFVIPRVYEVWRRTSPHLGFSVVAGGSFVRSFHNARKLV